MRTISLLAVVALPVFALISCESTNSIRAGGGAFDDSETGRKLDGNALLPDPENPSGQSFEEWRELD